MRRWVTKYCGKFFSLGGGKRKKKTERERGRRAREQRAEIRSSFLFLKSVVWSFCCFIPLPDGKPDHRGEWPIRQDSEVFGCVFVCTVTLRKLETCWKKSLLGRTCSRAPRCIEFLPWTRLRVTYIYTDTDPHAHTPSTWLRERTVVTFFFSLGTAKSAPTNGPQRPAPSNWFFYYFLSMFSWRCSEG